MLFHEEIIPLFAKYMRPNLYVELGVFHGDVINRMLPYCNRCIGVDISTPHHRVDKRVEYYKSNTMTFFNNFKQIIGDIKIDMLFIDADHSFEAAKQDLLCYSRLVADNGIIFIHDTWPKDVYFTSPGYCGDSWKLVNYLNEQTERKWEFITIPHHPGLTIIRNGTNPAL